MVPSLAGGPGRDRASTQGALVPTGLLAEEEALKRQQADKKRPGRPWGRSFP